MANKQRCGRRSTTKTLIKQFSSGVLCAASLTIRPIENTSKVASILKRVVLKVKLSPNWNQARALKSDRNNNWLLTYFAQELDVFIKQSNKVVTCKTINGVLKHTNTGIFYTLSRRPYFSPRPYFFNYYYCPVMLLYYMYNDTCIFIYTYKT